MYHATMPYLRKSLRRLARWVAAENVTTVSMPKIGAGLGKLSWEREVKPLMVELLTDSVCEFTVIEGFKREYENNARNGE